MKGDYFIVMRMHQKTLILVLLHLVSAPAVFADEFEIRNFKKDPLDYSAIRSERKDVNGQACAILKVRTDLTGLSFECNQGITGDPGHKTGEVWLYISPREKRIKFMKEGFIPEDFLFPVPIESATVYTIVLTNKYKTGARVVQSMGFVLIKSDPPGAEVTLNGEPTGMNTPFSKPLSLGSHQFGLNKEFYLPHQDNFEITPGRTTTIEIPLTANFGSLTITSQPESEAEIWIDGKPTEKTTPATFEMLSAGSHTLTLKKGMFERLAREFSITSGQETKLNLSMTPTFGSFSISTTPPAEIWIDQVKVGTGTYSRRLLKGLHMIEARLDKHDTITESITIDINTPITLQWQMVPKTGTLSVNTNPPEASIYLDGNFKGSSPLFIQNVIIGPHILLLSKEGHTKIERQVIMLENQILEVSDILPEGEIDDLTPTPSGIGTFTDPRDEQAYRYVKIGKQVWMAENVNYSVLNSCCYDNNVENCEIYGRLYTWIAAMKVCPQGWYLPSDDEWKQLSDFLGGEDVAGGKMKEEGTAHWLPPNKSATNSSGFTALPGGYNNFNKPFYSLGGGTTFWSSTVYLSSHVWSRLLLYNYRDLRSRYRSNTNRYSVRCIKDD